MSDQINTYVKEGKFIIAPSVVQSLLSPTIFYSSLAVLAGLFVLTFIARRSDRKFKQRSNFDLFKTTKALSPEDLEFTVLPKGQAAQPGERPYYKGYVSREYQSERISDQEKGTPATDYEVLKRIKQGDLILLIGQPTEGKTRSAYELLKDLGGFIVVSIKPNRMVPQDAFSILKNKRVIIFIDDLSSYLGRPADLIELYTKTKKLPAKQVVILATCRSGSELDQVTHSSSGSNRFYEMFTYKLSLVPITDDQKREIADESGLPLAPDQIHNRPTPGWVVMDNARNTMEGRFNNLTPEAKDTLYSLILLEVAGVNPLTHQRIEGVLNGVFQRTNIHLLDILSELFENSFIKSSANSNPVHP